MSDALPQGLASWIYDIRETLDRVRRLEDRLDKISDAEKSLERLLDAHPEGSWQARALDAERELAKAAKRIVELERDLTEARAAYLSLQNERAGEPL